MTRTLTVKSGGTGTNYNVGWHTVTVSKANYGDWNGTKYIDVYFNDYPDNFNMRVYAKQGKDGEEFAIGQIYRFANAGITGSLEGPDGTKVIKMDDSVEALKGKAMNVYFYKQGKYSRVLNKTAPTVFENEVESFSEDDVIYWKGRAETYYKDYVEPKLSEETPLSNGTAPTQEESSTGDGMPF